MVATLVASSSSRTPRQQLVLAHTGGRARVDAMVVASGGSRASGRRSLTAPDTNPVHPRGTKRVPDAVATRNKALLESEDPHAPGAVPPPAGRRHYYRDATCDMITNPNQTKVKRGVKYFAQYETPESAGNTSLKPAVDISRLRRADSIKDILLQRAELASPARHGYTFVPQEKPKKPAFDAHGGNKGKRFWQRETAESAVIPPWV